MAIAICDRSPLRNTLLEAASPVGPVRRRGGDADLVLRVPPDGTVAS